AHDDIGAFVFQGLDFNNAGPDQQINGNRDFEYKAECKKYLQHKTQVAGNIWRYSNTFRSNGDKKSEYKSEEYIVGKGNACIKQDNAGNKQRNRHGFFIGIKTWRYKCPDLVKDIGRAQKQ